MEVSFGSEIKRIFQVQLDTKSLHKDHDFLNVYAAQIKRPRPRTSHRRMEHIVFVKLNTNPSTLSRYLSSK